MCGCGDECECMLWVVFVCDVCVCRLGVCVVSVYVCVVV